MSYPLQCFSTLFNFSLVFKFDWLLKALDDDLLFVRFPLFNKSLLNSLAVVGKKREENVLEYDKNVPIVFLIVIIFPNSGISIKKYYNTEIRISFRILALEDNMWWKKRFDGAHFSTVMMAIAEKTAGGRRGRSWGCKRKKREAQTITPLQKSRRRGWNTPLIKIDGLQFRLEYYDFSGAMNIRRFRRRKACMGLHRTFKYAKF